MPSRDRHPIGDRPARRFHWISRLALVLALVTVFSAGVVAGRSPSVSTGGASQSDGNFADQDGYQTLEDTWDLVSTQYVDFANVDSDDLFWGASSGLVDGLGDTGHSRFLNPTQAIDFIESTQGRLIGIGVQIRSSGTEIFFSGVIDGGPAQQAGVQRGDVLLRLNGDDVTGLELDALDPYLDGVAGHALQMEVYRPTTEETLSFDLVQREIVVDPVSWTMLPDDVALIRLSSFSEGSADALREAIGESLDAGATSIAFDLRDNGGGIVEEARQIASQFLPEDTVIFRERYADGSTEEYVTDGGGVALDIPMVVLVNRFSASASEIVASALSENGRAAVIGQTTFGTGTILYPQQLDDDSLLVLGYGLWETPDGNIIWKKGFVPDEEVLLSYGALPLIPGEDQEIDEQELVAADDDQVDAAVEDLTDAPGGTPEASSDKGATPEPGAVHSGPETSAASGRGPALAIEPGLVGQSR